MNKNSPIGIYIHVPFCNGKCPYCDFYSVSPETDGSMQMSYFRALLREIDLFCAHFCGNGEKYSVDTIYFGGGTPLLLGAERLCDILHKLDECFDIVSKCEITIEVNPRSTTRKDLLILRRGGFDRLSVGAQSGIDSELAALGRRHNKADIAAVINNARSVGFDNISMDIMLAIPEQTNDSLAQTIDFYYGLMPEHISAYILKIEPDTAFGRMGDALVVPDEDAQAEIYLEAVRLLEGRGYHQYEISNFSHIGRESRHNLKYWNDEEYIGFGPAAHGFVNGRRYYHSRSLPDYIAAADKCSGFDAVVVDDGEGGGMEEYIMLRLRLADGLTEQVWRQRFGENIPLKIRSKSEKFVKAGLLISDDLGIRLTKEGFLLSNTLIAELISAL